MTNNAATRARGLASMRGDQWLTLIIDNLSGEQAAFSDTSAATRALLMIRKHGLHRGKGLVVDNRRVQPSVDLILVRDLAGINDVLQDLVELPARERATADRLAVGSGARRDKHALRSKLFLQLAYVAQRQVTREQMGEAPLPLFAAADRASESFSAEGMEPDVSLRPLTDGREVIEDYRSLQLSLRAHPLTFVRDELARRGVKRCADLASIRDGRHVEVAGIILVRQKPGSAKGVLFITIEDESGIANGILWPDRFEAQRRTIMSASMIGMKGRVQKEGEVIHGLFAEPESDRASHINGS